MCTKSRGSTRTAGWAALVLLVSCGAPASWGARQAPAAEYAALDDVTAGLVANSSAGEAVAGDAAQLGVVFDAAKWARQERMLVHRGSVVVEVARADEAIRSFVAAVEGFGGYLSVQQGTRATVRLPAARFDAAFELLSGMGRVLDSMREAEDVTEEYVDLSLRLETAQKARARLLALLDKAEQVEDMLKIETELRRLVEEIERMEGRRKFLADQVAMATLTGDFRAVAAPTPATTKRPSRFPWIRAIGAERVMEGF